jgi:hypothetical protein
MVLSHHERRRLEAIEANLHDEDPDLARRLGDWQPSPSRSAAGFPIMLMVIGGIGMLAGLLAANLLIIVVAGVIPLCVGLRLRQHRRDPGQRGGAHQ